MRPRPVNRLHLANNAFFKIEPALSPPEDFSHGCFAFERTINGMTHGPVLQIDLTVAAAGFEGETPAPLTQTTHLENFRGRKLVQIADERVARIDPFRGRPGPFLQRGDEPGQRPIDAIGSLVG